MHAARILKSAGGIPAQGNQMSKWSEGKRFGHPGADWIRALGRGPSESGKR